MLAVNQVLIQDNEGFKFRLKCIHNKSTFNIIDFNDQCTIVMFNFSHNAAIITSV